MIWIGEQGVGVKDYFIENASIWGWVGYHNSSYSSETLQRPFVRGWLSELLGSLFSDTYWLSENVSAGQMHLITESLQVTSIFTAELISCLQIPPYDQDQARKIPPCLPAQCFTKNATFIETPGTRTLSWAGRCHWAPRPLPKPLVYSQTWISISTLLILLPGFTALQCAKLSIFFQKEWKPKIWIMWFVLL